MTNTNKRPGTRPLIRVPRFFPDADERPQALELFFDLLFVFCIVQLARLLEQEPTWTTAAHMVLLFVPVWWTWINVTFCLDRFPTDDVVERGLVISAAGAAGVMGLALSDLSGAGSALFAVGYACGRLVVVVIYVRAARSLPQAARQCWWYVGGSSASGIVWFASIALPIPARYVAWVIAMVIDIAVPAVIDQRIGLLAVDVQHLPDRCGAFVVIVLGESLVTTASAAVEDGEVHGQTLVVSPVNSSGVRRRSVSVSGRDRRGRISSRRDGQRCCIASRMR